MYPTQFLGDLPRDKLKVTREVIWKEMEQLAEHRRIVDTPMLIFSVYEMSKRYRELRYNTSKLLREFEHLNPRRNKKYEPEGITPETIPWDIIPQELIERCFDENMELQVTEEILNFLGLDFSAEASSTETLFDTVDYESRIRSIEDPAVIASPIYDQYTNKRIQTIYYYYDEEVQNYVRAIVSPEKATSINRTYYELEWVVKHLETEDAASQQLGLSRDTIIGTLWGLWTHAMKYRKAYFEKEFLQQLAIAPVAQLREKRFREEKAYAITAGGKYTEDTSKLWEMVNKK